MTHVLPQFAHSASETAKKTDDEWSPPDARELNKLVTEETISRQVCLEEVVVVKREGRSQGFLTMITTRGVEKKKKSIRTMIEFNGAVIHRVTGSTLPAEAAALATAVGRQRYTRRLLVEALLRCEPQGGSA